MYAELIAGTVYLAASCMDGIAIWSLKDRLESEQVTVCGCFRDRQIKLFNFVLPSHVNTKNK
jgi:hypothetical protein